MGKQFKEYSQAIASKIELIKSLIQQKKFKEALAEIRDLETQKQIEDFTVEYGLIRYLLSTAFQGLGRYKEALSESQKAFDILKNTTENKKVAQIQFIRGIVYSDLGDLKKSELEFRDAITNYRREDDKRGIIDAYNELARICFTKSEYDKAIECLNECITYCDQIEDRNTKAKVSANLARIYILLGNWKLAEANLLVATKTHEEVGNKVSFCNGLLSLGYVYFLQRDFKKANKYYEQAVKIIFENNYNREFAIYNEYYGELAFTQGKYFLAKDHYQSAIKTGEEIAPESGIISQTYRLLAELQIVEKQYDEALFSCEKALKVAESLGEKIEIGAIHRALGQIYTALNRTVQGTAKKEKDKAKEHFEKSISILEAIGAKFELGKTYLEAVRSKVFEYIDCILYYGNGREIFRELGSDYHAGMIALAFCEFLFENGEYGKAEVFLREPEKIFKRLKEKKGLDLVRELKSKINKALGKVGPREPAEYYFSDIITQDPQMLTLIEEARRFKDSDLPILLEGDTGTGKDLLAMVIHCESKRKDKRFVKVNCAAIPETLLESELFGYKKGAFTGADRDKKGLFEEADGGTIFLNEIRDLPPRLQAKILDVIEDKELTQLGDVKPKRSDFRVIASTNKNLAEEVERGNFREDLYHRLKAIELKLPPLRERKQDIPLLIKHFLANSNIQIDSQDLDFRPYLEYDWPGNVRELENKLRKYTSAPELIDGLNKWEKTGDKVVSGKLMQVEKAEILEAIKTTKDKKEAAELLGISLTTLYRKIKFYDLDI